jgi:hypothetical protein
MQLKDACDMRTTVRLDERLLREAKRFAAERGRTFTSVLEDALRQFLAGSARQRPARPFRMLTFKGNGLRPGVDLDDSAALWDLTEKPR